jgi:hypothetical protein
MEKPEEESEVVYFEILSPHSPLETEENHKESQDIQCSYKVMNQVPHTKSDGLPLSYADINSNE